MTQTTLALHADMTGSGLAGQWLIGGRAPVVRDVRVARTVMLRADLELAGPLGGVIWEDPDSVTDAERAALRRYLWHPDGRLRAGAALGPWRRLGHLLAAACGSDVVAVSAWLEPVVCAPEVRCVRVRDALTDLVRVHRGGDVVALLRAVP
jgi:hypothetical protein